MVWNSGPDDMLLTDAEANQLSSQRLVFHLERMLADDASKHAFDVFSDAWLGTEELLASAHSPGRLGSLPAQVVPALISESREFVSQILRKPSGTFAELMLSNTTTHDMVVATQIYELPAGAQAPRGRLGILSLPAVMWSLAHANQTSPVLRGKWLSENVLCVGVPPPPADVVAMVSAPDPSKTTRERAEAHRADSRCSGCHTMLDGVGLAFEAFDQYGRFRSAESGRPIDGQFQGVSELGQRLSQSAQAHRCFAQHWFRYAFGRHSSAGDDCLV
jgi:hypothetical protein